MGGFWMFQGPERNGPREIHSEPPFLLISDQMSPWSTLSKAVVLVTRYAAHGSFGVQLNFRNCGKQFNVGGPSSTVDGVLHRVPSCGGERLDQSGASDAGLWWGGRCTVEDLKSQYKSQPTMALFFQGYSSWGPGQLDNEIRQHFWQSTQTIGTARGPGANDVLVPELAEAHWQRIRDKFFGERPMKLEF